MTPEEHKRIVQAGLSKFRWLRPRRRTVPDEVRAKLDVTTREVMQIIRPVQQAGGWKDEAALGELIATNFLERFSKYTKDEMEIALSLLFTEIAKQMVRADPWAVGTADKMADDGQADSGPIGPVDLPKAE